MAKYLKNNNGKMQEEATLATSAGASSATLIPHLDANGKLDISFMPASIGADTAAIVASEALAAGDFVNVFDAGGGVFNVRKADASNASKDAHGYVTTAVTSGASATVLFDDSNTGVTAQSPGPVYLSGTTAGKTAATPPTTSGYLVQRLGVAVSATNVHVAIGPAITLA